MKRGSKIKTVAIAGAGTMGSSLAQIFARYGYSVVLYLRRREGIDKSQALISINQRALIEQGDLTPDESKALLERIVWTTETNDLCRSDFLVEAITEDMDAKRLFWNEASSLLPEDVVLTTNTSGLSITAMSESVRLPERFCGMHWINPPHIVPLVEVTGGARTSEETLEIVSDVALSLGKHPVTVRGDPQGFILNRLQFALLREALSIVEKGHASIKDVDDVMKYGLGMRYACIGPFETVDLGGLDTFYRIASYLFADLNDEKKPSGLLSKLYHEGAYGTKAGRGFYDYSG
ncbi:MAG: 3-hydroxyacyl-CoA dehydrogenase family protein, partial [Synergistaceae bacterium]|nr:3-hydroxyacyl-CoA dehydrogenase family protein [Synergistaceae bacterium]